MELFDYEKLVDELPESTRIVLLFIVMHQEYHLGLMKALLKRIKEDNFHFDDFKGFTIEHMTSFEKYCPNLASNWRELLENRANNR